ncbi:capsid cement protein [Thiothrix nivea]|uniref:DUF2190 domain-containing protein n=1 Tax=Thiothrix nivea (strain ATCC 35100 / DSM 5205 / JP2) TaxID=870187 RepID=A0A656HCZ7_THINJ|nr:capsid cement protein [Thiothrix nivea]EIJ33326.1 hypothetical protein Thini_0689 [Thiothrix nivea DSM 5205]
MVRGLVKNFVAGAAVTANRIVKHGAADDAVIHGAAATDKLLGVADADAASGARVDVVLSGVADVAYGGTVARGDLLTADANGKAVVASTGNRVVGVALVAGVAGDIGEVLLAQH